MQWFQQMIVFKRIFGHKGNEKITSDLISSILGREIKDVDLTKNTILEKDLQTNITRNGKYKKKNIPKTY